MNSRGENMILKLTRDEEIPDAENVAKELLGRTVYAGWPHMTEVLVTGVSDGSCRCFSFFSFTTISSKSSVFCLQILNCG